MSVGSPALAAYSLALTVLNARSVYRRVKRIKYRNKAAVARALISLQRVPLELTKDELFPASISISNQWEQEIVDRLLLRHLPPEVLLLARARQRGAVGRIVCPSTSPISSIIAIATQPSLVVVRIRTSSFLISIGSLR